MTLPDVEALSLDDCDVLVMRLDCDDSLEAESVLRATSAALSARFGDSAPLLVCLTNPGDTLEALDEDDMRAAGWVRA